MGPTWRWLCILLLTFAALCGPGRAQQATTGDLASFERRAQLSKQLGATHMLVTDGLPLATWEMDRDDPYPMWFVHHAGLLALFPPAELAPFVDAGYVAATREVLRRRCAVLGKYGLKAVWNANEPAVLPEAFFAAHPELRGPRIDQPNRSRKVYFAPSIDQPETLKMYRKAMQSLLSTCPVVDQFNWVTTDAGSGFDWSPALYPGVNGDTQFQGRSMADRVAGFLINAQQAAKAAGHDVQINLRPIEPRQWMIHTFSEDELRQIVHQLPAGLAVEGREGPDDHPFRGVSVVRTNAAPFYPVVGLVLPSLTGGGDLWPAAATRPGSNVMINFGDSASVDSNFALFQFSRDHPTKTIAERVAMLRVFAASQVGEGHADDLMEAWSALNDVATYLQTLNFGDMLRMGHLLNRWITRPMVPFPTELTANERADYREFLFQAKGEEQAADLADIQAMRMYEGWGAHLLFQHTVELAVARAQAALQRAHAIAAAQTEPAAKQQWTLTAKRIEALICLLRSADNMVAYQAQLDRVKALQAPVEENPVLGTQSSWDRTDLLQTARREIDNMVMLEHMLQEANGPILDLAPSAAGENTMQLGPNVAAQIHHKVATMNAHWRDYDRLFTKPNP